MHALGLMPGLKGERDLGVLDHLGGGRLARRERLLAVGARLLEVRDHDRGRRLALDCGRAEACGQDSQCKHSNKKRGRGGRLKARAVGTAR